MRWQLSGRQKSKGPEVQEKKKKEKDDANAVNYVCILFKVWEMAAARESGRGCDRFVTESVTGEGRLELTFLLSWLCRWRSCKLGMRSEAGQVRVAAQLNMVQPFFVPWQTFVGLTSACSHPDPKLVETWIFPEKGKIKQEQDSRAKRLVCCVNKLQWWFFFLSCIYFKTILHLLIVILDHFIVFTMLPSLLPRVPLMPGWSCLQLAVILCPFNLSLFAANFVRFKVILGIFNSWFESFAPSTPRHCVVIFAFPSGFFQLSVFFL